MNMTELVCYDEPCYVDVANRLAVDSGLPVVFRLDNNARYAHEYLLLSCLRLSV